MPAIERATAIRAFKTLLVGTKRSVELCLGTFFDAAIARRAEDGKEVERVLRTAKELSLRGGKRFRAALLASSYRGVTAKAPSSSVVWAGVSLELLQSYLLVQDDWMDGDVERRGGPSAHVSLARAFKSGPLPPEHAGAVGALLLSDFVWGLSLEALQKASSKTAASHEVFAEFLRIHEDVVAGQVLDTIARKRDVERLHDLKTGSYTVRGPLRLGAILGGAPRDTVRSLDRYGKPLGVAFQLRDDLLGVFGTAEESGRPQGSDLMAKKDSAVVKAGWKRLRGRSRQSVNAVWGNRTPTEREMDAAISALEDCGARTEVEERLGALCTEAERSVATMKLSSRCREELVGASMMIRVGPGGRAVQ